VKLGGEQGDAVQTSVMAEPEEGGAPMAAAAGELNLLIEEGRNSATPSAEFRTTDPVNGENLKKLTPCSAAGGLPLDSKDF
jgi:hypothetical protein